MEKLLTTKDLAEAIGASESSLRRWTNSGAIGTSRTVGGHRRIPLSEAIRFIRETHATVVRPDILGIAVQITDPLKGGTPDEEGIFQALQEGDSERARGAILALYLGGANVAGIFDGPMQHAMKRIGELWQHDARGILAEHRATDICIQAINKLRELLAPVQASAPVAIGGAPQGDRYLLPSLMVATVLADTGYREINFGPDTPVEFLGSAAAEYKASIVWLSVSVIDQKAQLQRDVEKLVEELRPLNTRLLIGGRAANDLSVRNLSNVHVLQSMTELAAFTRGAKPPSPPDAAQTLA
ncbi:MAG: B12-binding domain-containing protein [Planctomycetota bacterium]|nr:B12-binding domain-containing protein [Planctomycetota bacterium]